jgi:hypothetical protein
MINSNIYYELKYYDDEDDEDNPNIQSINIIQKTENSFFSFEIKLSENEKIIDKIKLFTNDLKKGYNNIKLNIIYDKFNKQQICYEDNKYTFIADFFGQTSGYYTVKFITESNLIGMFEDLIKDYDEIIYNNLRKVQENSKKEQRKRISRLFGLFWKFQIINNFLCLIIIWYGILYLDWGVWNLNRICYICRI